MPAPSQPPKSRFQFRLRTLFIAVGALAVTGTIQARSGRWGYDSYLYGWPLPFYDSSPLGQGLVGPSAFQPLIFVFDIIGVTASIFAGIMYIVRKLF